MTSRRTRWISPVGCLSVGLLLLTIGTAPHVPPGIRVGIVAAATASFLGGQWTADGGATQRRWFLVLALYGVGFASTLYLSPAGEIWTAATLAVPAVAAAALASRLRRQDVETLRSAIVTIAVGHAVIALHEFLTQSTPFLWGYPVNENGLVVKFAHPMGQEFSRAQGLLGHPIPLATLLLVGAVLAASAIGRQRFVSVALVILSLGILATGTRSAILAAVMIGLLVVALRAPVSLRLATLLILPIVVCAVLLYDFGFREQVDDLLNSGSYTNRAQSIGAFSALMERQLVQVFFGSGYGSETSLYAQGFLPANQFQIVDNQFITTLAQAGIVGLGILIMLCVAAFRQRPPWRYAAAALILMMFSFDMLRWPAIASVLAVVAALPGSEGDVKRLSGLGQTKAGGEAF